MKRGPKPELPSTKVARGTLQPVRDAGRIEMVEPDALPNQPDWLTPAGEEVWQDNVGRVAQTKLANERDSTLFATYCNLVGACVMAWRAGEAPPAAYLTEVRRLSELFGLAGARSRIRNGAIDGKAGQNPFVRNRPKPAGSPT